MLNEKDFPFFEEIYVWERQADRWYNACKIQCVNKLINVFTIRLHKLCYVPFCNNLAIYSSANVFFHILQHCFQAATFFFSFTVSLAPAYSKTILPLFQEQFHIAGLISELQSPKWSSPSRNFMSVRHYCVRATYTPDSIVVLTRRELRERAALACPVLMTEWGIYTLVIQTV